MKIAIEDAGPCRKVMKIDASADEVGEDYSQLVSAYKEAGSVPGFRAGKAPKQIVEKHYQKRLIKDAKDHLIPKLYHQAIVEKKLTPVAVIDVADVVFEKETGLQFSVTVDVPPEFKLPKYKKIPVKAAAVEVTDEQVAEAMNRALEGFAQFEEVEGRAVQSGDLVQIDYVGTCEGASLQDMAQDCSGLGDGKDFWALVGEPEFLPGFTSQLEGLSIGDEAEVKISFPADYHVPAVAGKEGVYATTVKAIRERKMPELDEELLKRFGVASEDELRTRVREDLTRQAESAEKDRQREEVGTYLLGKTKLDVPQSIVDQEMQMMMRNLIQRSMMQGVSREQLQSQQAEMLEQVQTASGDRVKLTFILTRIAAEEKMDVSDDDVTARIDELAPRYRMTPEQLREELEKSNGLENLRGEMRADKAMTFLLENAKIKK